MCSSETGQNFLHQVIKKVADTCYMAEGLSSNWRRRLWRRFKVHSSQILRYHPRRETDWSPENDNSDCEDENFVPASEENAPFGTEFPTPQKDVPEYADPPWITPIGSLSETCLSEIPLPCSSEASIPERRHFP